MEGPGDGEFYGLSGAVFLGQGDGDDDFGGFTREDNLSGSIDIGHIHISNGGQFAHTVFLAANDRRHGAFRPLAGFLHGAGALVHEAEPGLKIEGSGCGMGGELSKREAGGGLKIEGWEFFFQNGKAGEAVDIKCRLADRGLGEFLGRAFKDDLAERIAKDGIGSVEEIGSTRILGGKILAHTDGLGALTRENESCFFHK